MIFSHYFATAKDKHHKVKYSTQVYSFDEALYNFNDWREDPECLFFEITYPIDEYEKEFNEKSKQHDQTIISCDFATQSDWLGNSHLMQSAKNKINDTVSQHVSASSIDDKRFEFFIDEYEQKEFMEELRAEQQEQF